MAHQDLQCDDLSWFLSLPLLWFGLPFLPSGRETQGQGTERDAGTRDLKMKILGKKISISEVVYFILLSSPNFSVCWIAVWLCGNYDL